MPPFNRKLVLLHLFASVGTAGSGVSPIQSGIKREGTQYVGFLGAWNFHVDYNQLCYGVIGALVTTYVTFLPCFMFIFIGAPYIEALAGNRRIQAALVGVTSAVVGVILNLAVFFGGKVLFPIIGTFDIFALVIAIVSFILLQKFQIPIHLLVPIGAVIGMAWSLLKFSSETRCCVHLEGVQNEKTFHSIILIFLFFLICCSATTRLASG